MFKFKAPGDMIETSPFRVVLSTPCYILERLLSTDRLGIALETALLLAAQG
jgi:hypothetical protein